MTIIRHAGEPFEVTVPVIVVGGGGCGLAAAIAAARDGAEVLVLERAPSPAGSTAMSLGMICAAGTRLQAEAGIEDSADKLFDDIMAVTKGQTDPEHARFFAEQSGPTMDWLTGAVGLDMHVEHDWPGFGHSELRCHGTPNNSGEELVAMLLDAARDVGANILTGATVTALIANDPGEVVGVRFGTPDGEQSVGCRALILACGGFGANRKMVEELIPEMAEAEYHGCEDHRGDAVIWGRALGARTADLGSYQGIGTLTPYGFSAPHYLMMQGGIIVNRHGERFMDETRDLSSQGKLVSDQPDHAAWIIYDQAIHDRAKGIFLEYRENATLVEGGGKADSWGELARKSRIELDGLRKSVDLAEQAGICPYGREFAPEISFTPPFYALRVRGAIFHTQGGLCIDRSCRVLRDNGTPFPNLFAGGGSARSVTGPAEWGYLPAIGLGTAVIFGRIAGQQAAKLAAGAD